LEDRINFINFLKEISKDECKELLDATNTHGQTIVDYMKEVKDGMLTKAYDELIEKKNLGAKYGRKS
jgi:hypothetical protein